ncbi:4-(cytidine 5'-diphospho)-2-C-methyl-D-erythritol kinase [Coraliomargarita akajimensis]|uniref:4-diphosphocytidyl-2-C-methyl-D-erythritol kinase n=1 Tax=Coraliomargarita akajimensis (strain DSM 45221 / IAM 15411 / JCM 23193 / KCTC 12865 / 04OKA010-24) TaxID=583355 RepID=D5EN27_CORAD|nr:4-(cytidine 5'-diphospho)-2-C-methyl-D-erythritol kinase [Coraliomargarita akajimensis]ADE53462.1 4-diphosphocytidyl-2C-methyl-D-erythritolkinase [Coraliomargarita akajimensis DSM 45221]
MTSAATPRLQFQSPAKINLFLAVHRRRDDGFHELSSLVAPLSFGDLLEVSICDGDQDHLSCAQEGVPTGAENLILQAAQRFREATEGAQCFEFSLDKRIPMGAGLGGGSGNAATALRAMNQLCHEPLSEHQLLGIAAELGSDCPLFLTGQPTLMRGRGEQLESLPADLVSELCGRKVLLFKPDFPIATAGAYQRLIASAPHSYISEVAAGEQLEAFYGSRDLGALLYNSFEGPIGEKFIAIPTLLNDLRSMGLACLMSGSGSCCFALPGDDSPSISEIKRYVTDAWGETVFFVETSIAAADTRSSARSR